MTHLRHSSSLGRLGTWSLVAASVYAFCERCGEAIRVRRDLVASDGAVPGEVACGYERCDWTAAGLVLVGWRGMVVS